MKKRGQVTIFIVLGIVILASISFVYLVRTDYFKSEFEKERDKVKIPEQLAPVNTFLESCLNSLASDAIKIVGANGGYYSNAPSDLLPRSVVNPFSNSLEVFNGVEIPYWFYESVNGIQTTQIPTKRDMAKGIQTYVDENFYEYCITQLNSFVEQGYSLDLRGFGEENTINIEDTHVEIIYDFPIFVELNEVGILMEKHYADVEINLGQMYDLATKIIETENSEFFLEEKTIDIMSVYDEIPYSEVEFSCDRKVWSKDEVVSNFKEIVRDNIRALKLDGTGFERGRDIYDYFVVDVGSVKNLNAATFYYSEDWPFVVNVQPEENGILTGDAITQNAGGKVGDYLSSVLCINNYHFVYDVKYPVLVTLVDEEGFVFQFASMVIVDNNQPRENLLGIIDYEDEGNLGEAYCGSAITETSVVALDASNMNEIANANVFFKCFTTECNMGKTEYDGLLVSNFPQCMNGLVSASKDGYFRGETILSTNVVSQASVLLEPLYDLDYEIKVIEQDGSIRELLEDEEVVFTLENENAGFSINIEGASGNVALIGGDYLAKSYLIKEAEFELEISEGSAKKCVSVPRGGILGVFFKEEKCFDFDFDETTLDEAVVGGAEFSMRFERYSLDEGDRITFYTVFDKNPSTYEEVKEIHDSIEFNHLLNVFRYPIVN